MVCEQAPRAEGISDVRLGFPFLIISLGSVQTAQVAILQAQNIGPSFDQSFGPRFSKSIESAPSSFEDRGLSAGKTHTPTTRTVHGRLPEEKRKFSDFL